MPGEEPVESSAERFGIIRGYRTIELLESLENLEVYLGRQRLAKDNVWVVRDRMSILVAPKHRHWAEWAEAPTARQTPESRFSLKGIENGEELHLFVVCDVYDAANEHVLIAAGSMISDPMEVRIADWQISLTIAGNYFKKHPQRVGGSVMGGYLIEPRTLVERGWRGWNEVDFEEWRADILRNPALSTTLLFTDSDDAEERDSLNARFSRNAEGQLQLHLPYMSELTVRRSLYFSSPNRVQSSSVDYHCGYFLVRGLHEHLLQQEKKRFALNNLMFVLLGDVGKK